MHSEATLGATTETSKDPELPTARDFDAQDIIQADDGVLTLLNIISRRVSTLVANLISGYSACAVQQELKLSSTSGICHFDML